MSPAGEPPQEVSRADAAAAQIGAQLPQFWGKVETLSSQAGSTPLFVASILCLVHWLQMAGLSIALLPLGNCDKGVSSSCNAQRLLATAGVPGVAGYSWFDKFCLGISWIVSVGVVLGLILKLAARHWSRYGDCVES